jgi:integral membrane protein (TIGR01906 family)
MSAMAREAAGLSSLPSILRWLGAALFVLAVPSFLIATNVLQLTSDLGFYERGFAKYDVSRTTGLDAPQLRRVAQAFIAYFDGRDDALELTVEIGGARRPLFNQRELDHMRDVEHIMALVGRLQIAAGVAIAATVALGLAPGRTAFLSTLGKLALAGGGLTLGLLVLLGGLSLVDFSSAFLQFHLIMFDNDLWILDPRRDYLVMLFPQGFWFDATIRIAAVTAIEAAAIAAVGLGLLRWRARA